MYTIEWTARAWTHLGAPVHYSDVCPTHILSLYSCSQNYIPNQAEYDRVEYWKHDLATDYLDISPTSWLLDTDKTYRYCHRNISADGLRVFSPCGLKEEQKLLLDLGPASSKVVESTLYPLLCGYLETQIYVHRIWTLKPDIPSLTRTHHD